MSTADDAWRAWSWLNEVPVVSKAERTAFMAGYRRALEDAADEWEANEPMRSTYAHVKFFTTRLRQMAAGVGTKDGDDDE